MKKTKEIYKKLWRISSLAVLAIWAFTSCQKVIHVDLNTSNSQVVIEAYVTDQPGIDTVKLSKTGSYFNPGNYPYINGATVIVSDNAGTIDTFKMVDSGKYASTHLLGIPGHTYSLKVFALGKEYDAVSTMPAPVTIDSLIAQQTGNVPDTGYRFRAFFLDPVGLGNFYRAQIAINHVLQDSADDISIDEDKFSDGLEQNLRLRGAKAFYGDSVKVDVFSIDANTYNYFSVLRSIVGAGNPVSTATPQNPPTNIMGGALGYFSAQAMRSQSMVAP